MMTDKISFETGEVFSGPSGFATSQTLANSPPHSRLHRPPSAP